MYKFVDYGSKEYYAQEADKKERAFRYAVKGFALYINSAPYPDARELYNDISVLKSLAEEYNTAVINLDKGDE